MFRESGGGGVEDEDEDEFVGTSGASDVSGLQLQSGVESPVRLKGMSNAANSVQRSPTFMKHRLANQRLAGDMSVPFPSTICLADGSHVHNANGEGPLLVSLRVCAHCQESLLTAFDHCLARQHASSSPKDGTGIPADGAVGLHEPSSTAPAVESSIKPFEFAIESIHHIDEVTDGMRLTEQPYFEIVKDPTRKKNAVFVDGTAERIAREMAAYMEMKRASEVPPAAAFGRSTTTNAAQLPSYTPATGITGKSIDNGHVFSGALYKRTLEAKNREILMLRERLHELTALEKAEQGNLEKLRHALNKAVRYYVFAEEWQAMESSRLQNDVRCLKAEMSSLMAFLIHAEEEKKKLRENVKNLESTLTDRDRRIADLEKVNEDQKSKLHLSYKEYLAMNERVKVLQIEAERGSEHVQSQNEVLQRNLDRLSRDFEGTARDLAGSQVKIKELEFELEEMVAQFNTTGEVKKALEADNVKLVAELDRTVGELKETKKAEELLRSQNHQLEEELKEMQQIQSSTQYEMEIKISNLTSDLDRTLTAKRELEVQVKQYKLENDKLSSALKALTRSKDQLESASRVATQKHEKELKKRDEKIKELQKLRDDDAKTIKSYQETKEQLLYQVTDLQNSLDREVSNVNVLTFELAQLRRQSDEKIAHLDEEIQRLNAAKVNLGNDKRQLTDKVRAVRADLAKREEEYANLTAAFNKYKEEAQMSDSVLRQTLQQLRVQHSALNNDYNSLTDKYNMVVESNVKLKMLSDGLQKRLGEMEKQEVRSREEIKQLTEANEKLEAENRRLVNNCTDMKIHLDSVLDKVNELTERMGHQAREADNVVKERDSTIRKLNHELYQEQEEVKRLKRVCDKRKAAIEMLEEQLRATQRSLDDEIARVEMLETSLDDTRLELNSQRKLRLELERMHSRLDRRAEARELERMKALQLRNRLLDQVVKGLQAEQGRLTDIAKMLPKESDLVIIEAPEFDDIKPPDTTNLLPQQQVRHHNRTHQRTESQSQSRVPQVQGQLGPSVMERFQQHLRASTRSRSPTLDPSVMAAT
ncbi:hypothetical protein HK102_001424 [Quaeritorhiza haematococci]|nr:hypothetical protein HK102_001424 [Quaeritorhiza haematococci]